MSEAPSWFVAFATDIKQSFIDQENKLKALADQQSTLTEAFVAQENKFNEAFVAHKNAINARLQTGRPEPSRRRRSKRKKDPSSLEELYPIIANYVDSGFSSFSSRAKKKLTLTNYCADFDRIYSVVSDVTRNNMICSATHEISATNFEFLSRSVIDPFAEIAEKAERSIVKQMFHSLVEKIMIFSFRTDNEIVKELRTYSSGPSDRKYQLLSRSKSWSPAVNKIRLANLKSVNEMFKLTKNLRERVTWMCLRDICASSEMLETCTKYNWAEHRVDSTGAFLHASETVTNQLQTWNKYMAAFDSLYDQIRHALFTEIAGEVQSTVAAILLFLMQTNKINFKSNPKYHESVFVHGLGTKNVEFNPPKPQAFSDDVFEQKSENNILINKNVPQENLVRQQERIRQRDKNEIKRHDHLELDRFRESEQTIAKNRELVFKANAKMKYLIKLRTDRLNSSMDTTSSSPLNEKFYWSVHDLDTKIDEFRKIIKARPLCSCSIHDEKISAEKLKKQRLGETKFKIRTKHLKSLEKVDLEASVQSMLTARKEYLNVVTGMNDLPSEDEFERPISARSLRYQKRQKYKEQHSCSDSDDFPVQEAEAFPSEMTKQIVRNEPEPGADIGLNAASRQVGELNDELLLRNMDFLNRDPIVPNEANDVLDYSALNHEPANGTKFSEAKKTLLNHRGNSIPILHNEYGERMGEYKESKPLPLNFNLN